MGCGSSNPPGGVRVAPTSSTIPAASAAVAPTATVAKYQTVTIEPHSPSPVNGHGGTAGKHTDSNGSGTRVPIITPPGATDEGGKDNNNKNGNGTSPAISARGSGSGTSTVADMNASQATTIASHRPTPSNGLLELPTSTIGVDKRRGSGGSEPASARSLPSASSPHHGNGNSNGSGHSNPARASGGNLPLSINDQLASNGLPSPAASSATQVSISVAASESGPGAVAARAGPPVSPNGHTENGGVGHSSSGRRRTLVLVPLNRVGSIPLQVVTGATNIGGDIAMSPNGRTPTTSAGAVASSDDDNDVNKRLDRRRTMDRERDGALFEAQTLRRRAAALANSPGGGGSGSNGGTAGGNNNTNNGDASSPNNSARAVRRSTMERGIIMNVKRASGGPLGGDGMNAAAIAASAASSSQRRTQRIIDIAIASAASIQALAETLSSSSHAHLQRIRFTRSSGPTTLPPSSYHSEAIGSIIMALPKAPHITSLDLTDIASQVAVSKLASIFGRCHLQEVTIKVMLEPKYLALSEKSADDVARFKDNSSAYQFCEAIARDTRLVKLNMSGSQIGSIASDALSSSISHHISLTSLNLSSTVLGNVTAIENMLADNNTLLHLDLAANSFGEAGGRKLVSAISSNASLISLRLDHNGFNATTAALIIGAVKNHRTLRDFSIAHNPLGPDFGKVLSHLLTSNTTLQSLDLSATMMETKGAEVFSMALEKNRTLTSLSLAGNELTHMGGRYISDSLLQNPTNSLVYIDLRHNQIAHHNQISSLLKGCPGIITCYSIAGNLFKDGTEAKLNKLIRANRASSLHHQRECRLAFCMGMSPRLGRRSSIATFRTSPMYYSKVLATLFEWLPTVDVEAPPEPDDEWHDDPERERVLTRVKSRHHHVTNANDRDDSHNSSSGTTTNGDHDSTNSNNTSTGGNGNSNGSVGIPASVARLRTRHSRTRTLEDLPITGASTLAPLVNAVSTSISPNGTVHRSLAGFTAARGNGNGNGNSGTSGHDDAPIGFTPTRGTRAAAIITSSSTRRASPGGVSGRVPTSTMSTATVASHDDVTSTTDDTANGGGTRNRPRTRAGRLEENNGDTSSEPRTPKGSKMATRASVMSNGDNDTRPVTRGGGRVDDTASNGGVNGGNGKKKPRDMSKRRTMEARLPRPMARRDATEMVAAAQASGSVYVKK